MKFVAAALAGIALLLLVGGIATALITRSIETRYPPEGRFVDVDGGRLHYVEAGAADRGLRPTIVFLHGASSSHADPMLALGTRLGKRYRVIAFDRPGYGWSDRIDGRAAASPARQAEIIRDALARLNVTRAIIVAHSWAGAILPNLSLNAPDLVAGAVYLAPVLYPWPGGDIAWYYGPAASARFGWLMTRTITTPIGALAIDSVVRAVFAPKEPPADYADKARVALTLRPSAFQANAQDVSALYAAVSAQSERYRDIRVPTVIISGDADDIVWTNLHSRGLARDVPGARLIVLPGVGHMPHHAAPDRIIAEIDRLAQEPMPAE